MYAIVYRSPFPTDMSVLPEHPLKVLTGIGADPWAAEKKSAAAIITDAHLAALQGLPADDARALALKTACTLFVIETINSVPSATGRATLASLGL